jgi:hypothetical protein
VSGVAWLVFVVLAFFALSCTAPLRTRRRRRLSADLDEVPAAPSSPVLPDDVDADCDSEREEIELAWYVRAGILSRERYQARMAELAVRDEQRMPLVVPREGPS